MACDVDQIPVRNATWSKRPSTNGMEQVMELLALIDQRRLDGVIMATNFTFRWVQASKERAHPGYEFWGRPMVPGRCPRRSVKMKLNDASL